MICVQAAIGNSSVHGFGLFAREEIAAGKIVAIWPVNEWHEILREELLPSILDEEPELVPSHSRYAGKYFTVSRRELLDEEKINHSDDENLIHLFGICIARRNINYGEELTLNYKNLCMSGFSEILGDNVSVIGGSARHATLTALTELVSIVSNIQNWEG